MSNNPPWGTIKPNLSKLPPAIRKQLSIPIPFRPGEVHAKVIIFNTRPGQNIPNGRMYVTAHNDDPMNATPDKIQLELCDFTARYPVAAVVLHKDIVAQAIVSMVKTYLKIGGSLEDIQLGLSAPAQAPTHAVETPIMANPLMTYLEEMAANEADEADDK